jgi:hypothetical protein
MSLDGMAPAAAARTASTYDGSMSASDGRTVPAMSEVSRISR